MVVPKLIILLCCLYYSFASHQSHTIPVEGYETELQYLGQHVEIPETPVKVIKITKTIAVKVPVPYPVKVREKVPYPVHVAKPYPVPVPQIIKVPHIVTPTKQGHDSAGGGLDAFQQQHGDEPGNSYSVQETQDPADNGHSFVPLPESQSYGGANSGYNQNSFGDEYSEGSPGNSYGPPSNIYHGYSGNNGDSNSFESRSYDQALSEYLNKNNPSGNVAAGNGYNYH